jgi:hypothetical protein
MGGTTETMKPRQLDISGNTNLRSGLALLALMTLLVLSSMAGQAAAYSRGCGQIPIVYGIPPWGFHTGPPIGETGSYARGHGQIDLEANTVSGILCQEIHSRIQPTRAITLVQRGRFALAAKGHK